jgi:hypothetical protein
MNVSRLRQNSTIAASAFLANGKGMRRYALLET